MHQFWIDGESACSHDCYEVHDRSLHQPGTGQTAVLAGADEQKGNCRPATRSFLLEGPDWISAADDGSEGQRSEVAAVEGRWLVPVHEEDFAAPNHATALPGGEQATAAVTFAGRAHLDRIDGYRKVLPADDLLRQRQDSFDERDAEREIAAGSQAGGQGLTGG